LVRIISKVDYKSKIIELSCEKILIIGTVNIYQKSQEEFEVLRAFLVLSAVTLIFILPAISAVSTHEPILACQDLETYMASRSSARADIVFVFDTTASMGAEIREMKDISKDFAEGLVSKGVDYRLGLTAFKDFPIQCGSDEKTTCGESTDYPYKIYNDGALTHQHQIFRDWLNMLGARGGGDDPEAILAALRHTATDIQWRVGGVDRVVILITDAHPHPDIDCCNAEGDTLEGVISALTSAGVKLYVVGPKDEYLEKMSSETGGKFYEIRSGITLGPVLEDVAGDIIFSFSLGLELEPKFSFLEIDAELLGKKDNPIPYSDKRTEVWAYMKRENQTSLRYDLYYDNTSKLYHVVIEPAMDFVELTIYGRVCEWTTVEMIKVDCGADNRPPVLIDLSPDLASPEEYDSAITWNASAIDPNGDSIYYRFWLKGPSTGGVWEDQTGWTTDNLWTWLPTIRDMGTSQVKVDIRDGVHASRRSWDDQIVESYTIISKPPVLSDFGPDKPSPQGAGPIINWTAKAVDPEGDVVYYRFWLKGPATGDAWKDLTGWTTSDLWTWKTTVMDMGSSQIRVDIRDGEHAGPESWDDQWVRSYIIMNLPPDLTDLAPDKPSPQGSWTAINWTANATDPNGDTIFYRFWLKGPGAGHDWQDQTGWTSCDFWNWSTTPADIGTSQIRVDIRDGGHADPESWDDQRAMNYTITNLPPMLIDLSPNRPRPQKFGAVITWTANATDPEGDTLFYRFLIKGPSTGGEWKNITDWAENKSFIWSTNDSDIGANQFEVRIRDGNHASPESWDDRITTRDYVITRWEPTWESTYGGSDIDGSYSVQETIDKGFIVAGSTYSFGPSEYFWLIKTDPAGNEIWSKTFGGSLYERSISVQQTSDGGYIMTGFATSYGAGQTDLWLLKTDPEGKEEWNRTFGGLEGDFGNSVQQTNDSGYIIAGMTESSGAGNEDVWLLKTDSSGMEEWNMTFGGPGWDEAYSVQQTRDFGYIVAGLTESFGAGGRDVWLIKTDFQGIREWNRTFGGYDDDMSFSVQETRDGGFIMAGWTGSYGAGGKDIWLIKTDSLGIKEWDRTFGGSADDLGSSVNQTFDDGYIITGTTKSYSAGGNDIWLIKTDSLGNEEWDRPFGGSENDVGWSVQETSDGGYIIGGWTESYGSGDNGGDVWLIKVDSIGDLRAM
jgi:hypothetical protein